MKREFAHYALAAAIGIAVWLVAVKLMPIAKNSISNSPTSPQSQQAGEFKPVQPVVRLSKDGIVEVRDATPEEYRKALVDITTELVRLQNIIQQIQQKAQPGEAGK